MALVSFTKTQQCWIRTRYSTYLCWIEGFASIIMITSWRINTFCKRKINSPYKYSCPQCSVFFFCICFWTWIYQLKIKLSCLHIMYRHIHYVSAERHVHKYMEYVYEIQLHIRQWSLTWLQPVEDIVLPGVSLFLTPGSWLTEGWQEGWGKWKLCIPLNSSIFSKFSVM